MGKTKRNQMGRKETSGKRRDHRECDSRKKRGEEVEGEGTQIRRSKGRFLACPHPPAYHHRECSILLLPSKTKSGKFQLITLGSGLGSLCYASPCPMRCPWAKVKGGSLGEGRGLV